MHMAESSWTKVGVVTALLCCLLGVAYGVVYGVSQTDYGPIRQAEYDATLKRLYLFKLNDRHMRPHPPSAPDGRPFSLLDLRAG
jgi:hypothetical protein